MKKTLALIFAAALLAGCTSKNEYGECIGAFDEKKPGTEYKLSGWNLAMAVIFFETIVVPIVVVTDQTRCPVSKAK